MNRHSPAAIYRHPMQRPTFGDTRPSRAPDLPEPTLTTIGSYLNPHQLLQVSQVSRKWNAALTSNSAWAHFNVYGVDTSICKHYLDKCKTSTLSEFECVKHGISNDTNLHHLLVQLHGPNNKRVDVPTALTLAAPRAFFELAAQSHIYPELNFSHVPREFHTDKDLVYKLLRAWVWPNGLSLEYQTDHTAAMSIQDPVALVPSSGWWSISFDLLSYRDVALHAVAKNGVVYTKLPTRLQADHEIFFAHMDVIYGPSGLADSQEGKLTYLKAPDQIPESIRSDRKVLLKLFAMYQKIQPLNFLSASLATDWEVVGAALRKGPDTDELPLCCAEFHRISPELLKNRDHVVMIFEFGWLPCFGDLPKELRRDKRVLHGFSRLLHKQPRLRLLICLGVCRCSSIVGRLAAIHPFDIDKDWALVERIFALPKSVGSRVDKLTTRYAKRRLIFASLRMDYRPIPDRCYLHSVKDCRKC